MPYLDAVTGPAMGRRYPLENSQYVMGRHPDCDIVLESGSVSRQHARISKSGDSFLLEDMKSRNGSFVNGQLINEPTKLVEGVRDKVFRKRRTNTFLSGRTIIMLVLVGLGRFRPN